MAKERICGIYKIANRINNKVYIGQSINIEARWREHKSDFKARRDRHNVYFQRSWDKYGEENFEFEIIETCLKEDLDKREIYWVKHYKSSDTNFGYNADEGGNGRVINKETKFNMGTGNRGIARNNRKIVQLSLDGNLIKIWSNELEIRNNFIEETASIRNCCKKQRRKSAEGFVWVYLDEFETDKFDFSYYSKKHNNKTIPIVMMDLNYNYLGEFKSVHLASKELDIPHQNIDANIKGKTSRVKEYSFISKENYENGIKSLFKRSFAKTLDLKVAQLDLNNNLIKIWDSIKGAGNALNLNPSTILKCCDGTSKTAFGFKWIYA